MQRNCTPVNSSVGRLGHAGAIISSGTGDARTKIKTLEEAGIVVVKNPAEIGDTIAEVLRIH